MGNLSAKDETAPGELVPASAPVGSGEYASGTSAAVGGTNTTNPAAAASSSQHNKKERRDPASSSSTAAAGSGTIDADLDDTGGGNEDDDPVQILKRLFGDSGGVPMVFRWEGGGEEVFITGTFNNWSAKIPMSRSGNDFVHIHELSHGKHAYKFIVDDEWRFMPDQHTMADKGGNINNFVDLSDFRPKFDHHVALTDLAGANQRRLVEDGLYGNRIPDINDYTREPPLLPPHLKSIVLNYREGTVPLFVTLDHLHCTARSQGLMVLGMSQRLRQKFFTVVFYSSVQGGFQVASKAAAPTPPASLSSVSTMEAQSRSSSVGSGVRRPSSD